MKDDQLREIVERCKEQDEIAQEQLFKLLYGKMLGVCLRYTNDQDSAQEVVQQSFIKVFEKLKDFDFSGSFEGWVRRIMVNSSIDAIRKKKRRPFSSGEEYVFDKHFSIQEHDFEEDLTKIKAEYAIEAIQHLSPAYRTVFNLFVIENYSHQEIAEILNISEGTSKSNLAKAKQNLRKILHKRFLKIEDER